jgi:hypothetical protein
MTTVAPILAVVGVKEEMVGAGFSPTINESEAVPLLPKEEVRSPDVLTWVPVLMLVTSASTVQVLLAAAVPPVYEITLEPATAVRAPPVQVVEALAGSAITTSAGRLSVKSKRVAFTTEPVLLMVKVRVLVPP